MGHSSINKQNSCMDDTDPKSLAVSDALKNIYTAISPIQSSESLPIKESLNRVLAKDIIAPLNIPIATNSAMDGYALKGDDIPKQGSAKLKVIGTAFAGQPYPNKIGANQCVRIMTGATMPKNTDTVIIQENVKHIADTIIIDSKPKQGTNVRHAGEEIKVGDIVLSKGKRITPADIGLIASLGISVVEVTRKLRVAFFSTGDELCSIGDRLEDNHIYDSNRYTLFGMLSELNITLIDMGIVRDDREHLQQTLENAAKQSELIITTGGISVGDADFVKEVLQKIGTINFWKVAIKPGRPLAFGQIKDALFFGLPGNPVSVMVTFYQFIKPAIKYLMGEKQTNTLTIQVPCISKLDKRLGRVEYQRGILECGQDKCWTVKKTGSQGSGNLRSMSQANCFIILPTTSTAVAPGTIVEVQPFSNFII